MSGVMEYAAPGRCRVCLEHLDDILPLDNVVTVQDENVSLSHILVSCCAVEILDDDNKPQTVCTRCAQDAENSYKFKRTVEKADLTLKYELDNMMNVNVKKEEIEDDDEDMTIEELSVITFEDTPASAVEDKVLFVCDDCGVVLKSKNHMKKHVEEHKRLQEMDVAHIEDLMARTCKECGTIFISPTKLHEHVKRLHKKKQIKPINRCDECGMVFKSEKLVVEHKKQHRTPRGTIVSTGMNTLRVNTCGGCGIIFNTRKCMIIHKCAVEKLTKITKTVDNDEVVHKKLPKNTVTVVEEDHHNETQSKHERTCDKCGVILKHQKHMHKHKEQHRKMNEKGFSDEALIKQTCEECGLIFVLQRNFDTHIKTIHENVKLENICCECGVVLNEAEHMTVHKKQHELLRQSGEEQDMKTLKGQTCTHCGLIFKNRTNMFNHKKKEKKRNKLRETPLSEFGGTARERTCDECGKILNNKHVVAQHKTTEHSQKPTAMYANEITCDECGVVLKLAQHMVAHKEDHTHERLYEERRLHLIKIIKCYKPSSNSYECDDCDFKTEPRTAFEEHHKTHHEPVALKSVDFISKFVLNSSLFYNADNNHYQCTRCPFKDECVEFFEQHYKTHIREIICIYCGDTFDSTKVLISHKRAVHSELKPVLCTKCPRRFFTQAAMKCHFLKHTGEKNHVCEICGYACIQAGNLRRHMEKHADKTVRSFKCEVCGNMYFTQLSLLAHMKFHDAARVECDECGKTYCSRSALASHKRRHKADKRHKCTVCEKAFVTTSERVMHMRHHKGLKLHTCELCEKNFFTRHALKLHTSVHTGEKPHVCEMCGQAFRLTVSLRTHIAKHHG